MDLLKKYIQDEARILPGALIDVSSFFNWQTDALLMDELGKDFARYFHAADIDLIITVESSGIAPALFTSLYLEKPLVVVKKYQKQDDRFVQQEAYSYTKKQSYYLTCKKEFLEGKKVLLIDDFLASGSVLSNIGHLCEKADAVLIGAGICISKNFQSGYEMFAKTPIDLYCQVGIEEIDEERQRLKFI